MVVHVGAVDHRALRGEVLLGRLQRGARLVARAQRAQALGGERLGARVVGARERQVGARLGELRLQRGAGALHVVARALLRGLAGCDRVVPHRLLRRVEAELALERRDPHHDIAAAVVGAVVKRLRGRRAQHHDQRGRRHGGEP